MRDLVVGSAAMKIRIPNSRAPKDFDVFSPDAWSKAETFWHESFDSWIPEDTSRVATLDELYTIKVSHSYWDLRNGSWEKHVNDAMALKQAGAVLDMELHKLLYKVWEERYGAKRLDLEQESDEFFSDAVVRYYDHDSIHESVAYGDRPMYERILKDGRSVAIDMTKLKALPFEDQVKLFFEEIYATALERIMIPNNYEYSPRRAYAWALRRTITSLTKGWSARFLVENYDRFRRPDVDYVQRHLDNAHKLIPLEA